MNTIDGLTIISQINVIKQQEFNFLNTIDIEPYLKHENWSVLKMMDEIQEDHGSKYEAESYIFNAIEQEDFMDYVRKRYNGKYTFYMYVEARAYDSSKEA